MGQICAIADNLARDHFKSSTYFENNEIHLRTRNCQVREYNAGTKSHFRMLLSTKFGLLTLNEWTV